MSGADTTSLSAAGEAGLPTTHLGASGLQVGRLAMGCWAIGGHGWGKVTDAESIDAVRCAAAGGCDFFDTSDVYGLGHSETILLRALGETRHDVVIASKGGVRWDATGRTWKDCSAEYLSSALDASRHRLAMDKVPLYYLHWHDGVTPIERVMEAMERFRNEGRVGAIGVSNLGHRELQLAVQAARIDVVQMKCSVISNAQARELVDECREHGATPVFYGVLQDGLLTGKFTPRTTFDSDDHRARSADFSGQRFLELLEFVEELRPVAESLSATVGQIALRWAIDEFDDGAVLWGAKKCGQVEENLASAAIRLPDGIRERLNRLSEELRR